jgi:hypothetical protein
MATELEETEGLSTPKKVAAGAAIGVAIPAAVAVAKKLLGEDEQESGREERPKPRPRARPKPKAKPRARTRTREQLYAQATRLKIAGRSSMNKTQLERAVEKARQKKPR